MNKILLLVTTYCVSSSFVSPSGVRAPSNPLGSSQVLEIVLRVLSR